ncbi:MAG: hypothetical protein OXI96_08735 [Acidimicrobiaceae bacterium]|nr:hypothetical protein [Acidimicrobiaceae bacterium]
MGPSTPIRFHLVRFRLPERLAGTVRGDYLAGTSGIASYDEPVDARHIRSSDYWLFGFEEVFR